MGTLSAAVILAAFVLCGLTALLVESVRWLVGWWRDRSAARRGIAALERFAEVLADVRDDDGPVQVGMLPNVPGLPTAELVGGPRDGASIPVLVMQEQWPHVLHVPECPDGGKGGLARYVWDAVTVSDDGQVPVYAYAPRLEESETDG